MSSANLRIIKIEDECNYKSIRITIPNDDNSTNIIFGEWVKETSLPKDRETEKSSRLVVKIVSGEETKKFDLDACSKEIGETNNLKQHASALTDCSTQVCIKPQSSVLFSEDHRLKIANSYVDNGQNVMQSYNFEFSNPLEQSLQKVKENNARIMENINMLNRTLNYTKKKEVLDIMCGPKSIRTYPCTTCGKCFVYETGLRRHYAMRHAITEMQPRWQVVWTCIQCFQVWPQQDQALEHSVKCCKSLSDNPETVRDIKTSLLLQCEFCEKVYTSIPRLLRHSKIHTTISNYECNSCGLSFVSYKLAEQHWPLCPWLNKYYCFSLPKMLLCNACDRKFRNYEQLYNHRYKVGHFMTKTHITTGSLQSINMLVYQCELCAQWYNTIQQITAHKSEHHPHNDPSVYNNTDNVLPSEDNENYLHLMDANSV